MGSQGTGEGGRRPAVAALLDWSPADEAAPPVAPFTASFLAQMLGQKGGARGPALVARAHDSYAAAALLGPAPGSRPLLSF